MKRKPLLLQSHKINILIVLITSFLFLSCKGAGEMSQEKEKEVIHEIEYRDRYDSVYIDRNHYIYTKGDTVYKTDSVVEYRSKYIKDTVIKHDTVTNIQVKEIKTVVNKPVYWPIWVMLALAIIILVLYIYIKKKFNIKLI